MRTFPSGATRDNDDNKLDFEGFLSPFALETYAEYMHKHRIQADGNLRESDNWQKGIPVEQYMKSLWRHFFAVWKGHRQGKIDQDDVCAMLFNGMGILHEIAAPTRQISRNPGVYEQDADDFRNSIVNCSDQSARMQKLTEDAYEILTSKLSKKDAPKNGSPVALRAVEWAMVIVLGAAVLSSWAFALFYTGKIIS